MAKRTLAQKGTGYNAPDEGQIFKDFKPVNYEGLYKKEMSSEEILEEIKKLTEINKENIPVPESTMNKKLAMRSTKASQTDVTENVYPFKQDKFACLMF